MNKKYIPISYEKANEQAKKEICNMKNFLEWLEKKVDDFTRQYELYKQWKSSLTLVDKVRIFLCLKENKHSPTRMCDCIDSIVFPSWASSAHDIKMHICDAHAKHFSINSGPLFDTGLDVNEDSRTKRIVKRDRYWNDVEYRFNNPNACIE